MCDCRKLTVCREFRSHVGEVASLMRTSFTDDDTLVDLIMASACGYLLEHIPDGTDLVGAVRTAMVTEMHHDH
jgi:DNA-binding NarL/FixJ family response regulator